MKTTTKHGDKSVADDLKVLIGARAIADGIGASVSQTFHWLEDGTLPAFKIGRRWAMRPPAWREHVRALEAGEAATDVGMDAKQ